MIIIPAIDIIENKIVRLKKGDFNQVEFYPNSPVEQAKIFNNCGFKWIHIVDLLGSKAGSINILDTLKQIKSQTNLLVEFGGGIRSEESFSEVLDAGVDKIIVGSLSIQNKNEFEKIVKIHKPDKIIIAADVNNEMIAVKGWTEQTSTSVYEHIEYCLSLNINTFLCTDISVDGMLTGTNINLYTKILSKYPGINLIASGGISDIPDIQELVKLDIYGCVVGKAIYEGIIDLEELSKIGS